VAPAPRPVLVSESAKALTVVLENGSSRKVKKKSLVTMGRSMSCFMYTFAFVVDTFNMLKIKRCSMYTDRSRNALAPYDQIFANGQNYALYELLRQRTLTLRLGRWKRILPYYCRTNKHKQSFDVWERAELVWLSISRTRIGVENHRLGASGFGLTYTRASFPRYAFSSQTAIINLYRCKTGPFSGATNACGADGPRDVVGWPSAISFECSDPTKHFVDIVCSIAVRTPLLAR